MLRVTFLGTAAARPTVGRNVSALAVQREGDIVLFDCGEGTQRQMMRFATGFALQAVYVTHLHADHFLGITGLLRTMGLQGREEAIDVYGPPGSRGILQEAVGLGVHRMKFPVHICELSAGDRIERDGYDIVAFDVTHGTPAIGYSLEEHVRLGRFDPERARAMGVPEGPLWGRLHKGESVEVDGRTITPESLVGEPRPGRKLVYTGDTAPCRSVIEVAQGADVLIHDATFGEEEADRARQTFHSTSAGAASVAREAGVRELLLTHISARYADDPRPLRKEAKAVFQASRVAKDGLEVEIPFGEDSDA